MPRVIPQSQGQNLEIKFSKNSTDNLLRLYNNSISRSSRHNNSVTIQQFILVCTNSNVNTNLSNNIHYGQSARRPSLPLCSPAHSLVLPCAPLTLPRTPLAHPRAPLAFLALPSHTPHIPSHTPCAPPRSLALPSCSLALLLCSLAHPPRPAAHPYTRRYNNPPTAHTPTLHLCRHVPDACRRVTARCRKLGEGDNSRVATKGEG